MTTNYYFFNLLFKFVISGQDVTKVMLPLRFSLSQAFRLCLVVFQVCKRCLVVLV